MKHFLSDGTKASMMRLITFILAMICGLVLLGQLAVQVITAVKGNTIYTPEWLQIGIMIVLIIAGKLGQKYIENVKNKISS